MQGMLLTPEQAERLLGGSTRPAGPPPPKDQAVQARVLIDMLSAVHRVNPFKPGDLVVQAKGRTVYHFHLDMVFLVTHVYGPEVTAKAREGSNWPREDMLIVASVPCPSNGGEEHWRELAAESWRFERYEGPIE